MKITPNYKVPVQVAPSRAKAGNVYYSPVTCEFYIKDTQDLFVNLRTGKRTELHQPLNEADAELVVHK